MKPSAADVELEFYERFFLSRDLEPYPVQEEAFAKIFEGESLLVTVPTGTGKTMMAKAALMLALRTERTAVYTTPLRALTEEKYRELCDDFGTDNVGFATGDYKVNPEAPLQVVVAEILWNRIYSDQNNKPADIVVMDEGHYFNDPERGYVWEQSIIGLHPESQLVILSATIGAPQQFCVWAYQVRKVKMALVQSHERRVPLEHEYREEYLVDTVKALYAAGDYPAIIFSFGRKLSFERARLLRSCPRFVDKDEQAEILKRAEGVVLPVGLGPELTKLLQHGVGVHHAGVLPAYRRLVEELTAERLLKFVVTTETIAAGINLPAKRVVFPSLRKYIKKKARLLLPAEYHQMAGRAGRPQFDKEGIALTLAPEVVVQEFRKEIRDQKKKGFTVDEAKIRKKHYQKALTDARTKKDVTWDEEAFRKLVDGEPAALQSRTRITAEQILAIGLPDLEQEALPGEVFIEEEAARIAAAEEARKKALAEATGDEPADGAADDAAPASDTPSDRAPAKGPRPAVRAIEEAPYRRLNIRTVIDNLLLPEGVRHEAHKRLAMITANLQALGVLDSHGRQIDGFVINKLRGVDGPFVWYFMRRLPEDPEEVEPLLRALVELLIDHDVIHNQFEKKETEKRRQWILERLRELRRENPQVTFEDVEEEYWEKFPPEPSPAERIHQAFVAPLPHQELHGGKTQKTIWAQMEDGDLTFMDFVQEHDLAYEEGSLFTYLARVMKTARMLHEVLEEPYFAQMESRIRHKLAVIDERVMEGLW